MERINSEMQRTLAEIVRALKDPRVTEMVSVLEVQVAKDLKTAKAYVSIYGDAEKRKSTFEGLVAASGFIRNQLSRSFKELRSVPEITFVLDQSAEYGREIDSLLAKVKKTEKESE